MFLPLDNTALAHEFFVELTPSVPASCAPRPLERDRAAGQHGLGVRILADINDAVHVALEISVVDSAG